MKSPNDHPDNNERQALRDYLVANGMPTGDAARLTAPGQNRKQLSDSLIAHLRSSKKANP